MPTTHATSPEFREHRAARDSRDVESCEETVVPSHHTQLSGFLGFGFLGLCDGSSRPLKRRDAASTITALFPTQTPASDYRGQFGDCIRSRDAILNYASCLNDKNCSELTPPWRAGPRFVLCISFFSFLRPVRIAGPTWRTVAYRVSQVSPAQRLTGVYSSLRALRSDGPARRYARPD